MKLKHTYKERLEAGLAALGWVREAGSSKYSTWGKPECLRMFVGPAGALRMGSCVSRSHSIGLPAGQNLGSANAYRAFLAAGDKALEIARLTPKTEVLA